MSPRPVGHHLLAVAVPPADALPGMVQVAVDGGTWVKPMPPVCGAVGTVAGAALAGAAARRRAEPYRGTMEAIQ